MKLWQRLRQPPWRTVVPGVLLLLLVPLVYSLWQPGKVVTDGRHDRMENGIWLQHGWLGDDKWFKENKRESRLGEFRNREKVRALAKQLRDHHFTDVFPHLCPVSSKGVIPAVDDAQTELFLDEFIGFRMMPWVGGVLDVQVVLEQPRWRETFIQSATNLLAQHPRLAGLHLNVEPLPSGNANFLKFLDELKTAMPPGKVLSVAAYPPPTRWHQFPDVHWEEPYFREVARRSDQLAIMMYDTSLRYPKLYRKLMADWTVEVLAWSEGKPVLLGLPAYNDSGEQYHRQEVENLGHALPGIHAGLSRHSGLPPQYQGIAVYSEWEMSAEEWQLLESSFLKK